MATNPYETYKNARIQTANQGRLIVMLYEGAIRFSKEALKAIQDKKYDVANNRIVRAEDIVTELLVSLDYEKGGDIAKKLASIYIYMNQQLLEANITKSSGPLEVVINLMSDLKESWEKIAGTMTGTDNQDMDRIGSINIKG